MLTYQAAFLINEKKLTVPVCFSHLLKSFAYIFIMYYIWRLSASLWVPIRNLCAFKSIKLRINYAKLNEFKSATSGHFSILSRQSCCEGCQRLSIFFKTHLQAFRDIAIITHPCSAHTLLNWGTNFKDKMYFYVWPLFLCELFDNIHWWQPSKLIS